MTRELTGRHVLFIVFGAYALIIAINLTMLFAAMGTFPGLVVGNSYVASQGWNARANAQQNLGWSAEVVYQPGMLHIEFEDQAGNPVDAAAPVVTIGRPTTAQFDRRFTAKLSGTGFFVPVELAAGRWRIELTVGEPVVFSTSAEILAKGTD